MGWGDIFLDRFKDPVVLQDTAGGPKGYEVKYFTAKKDNSLTAPVKIVDGKVKERGTLFLDGQFPTKSKKIELWSKDLEREFASYGLTAIPRFYTDPDIASVACDETICYDRSRLIPSVFQRDKTYTFKVSIATKKEPERKFPFYLITGRPSEAIMGHTSHWIKKLNDLSPDQFCSLHIEVARRLGIKDGEHIEICSPYGKTWAKAILTSHIRKDTIFIPYSYGEKAPFTPWKSVNFLINMAARCPISGEVAFKGTMVSIKKHNKRR
ncbi:MAG: hypothetical protein GWP10_02170 [Nitrospiraceae bacterium]|nr:hypothetical protein [Nitrospiraceae bacterium]